MTPTGTPAGGQGNGSPPSRLAEGEADWRRRHLLPPAEDQEETTRAGLPVRSLYTPADTATDEDDYLERLGFPGDPPYTRGISANGYRDRPWVMGQYSGQSTPEETNRRIRSLLAQGQGGFSIALDLPTQNGLDSDHPLSVGEVGRVGVPIDTVADMAALLRDIPLDQISQIRTTANAIGPIVVAMLIVSAEQHGYSPRQFKVLLQNDVLKEYLARGTYVFPPRPALQFCVDVIEYCAQELPTWEPIEFCGYHIRDSGATSVQEVAIALANGIEYIDAALARGLSIDDFAPTVFLFLSAHLDIFEEVAKFRAARRIWHQLITGRYGAKNPESGRLNIFCYTLGSLQTAQEPLNNIVRISYQALAAILGGVQTLATSSFDEALGLPSDQAVRISLRTQQILAYETGVTRTVDPLGGSYLVERLTDEIEGAILAYLGEIEKQGGALRCLESGWLHAQVEDEAYRTQREVDGGDRVVVGLNRFTEAVDGPSPAPATAALGAEADQLRRLGEVRASRDPGRVKEALVGLGQVAREGGNTIPALIDAVRAYASIGEICQVLGEEWGWHDDHNR